MSTATISIGVEPAIKKAAAANAKAAGLDLPTVIRDVVNRLAHEPSAALEYHYPNAETRKAIHDLEHDINVTTYNSVDEFVSDLGW
jgi:antitoxin component of RelBE/YafQ-DinJ toxin-antitoxin module